MKAFLLAAGHGTRLRPLTDTVPKCLVPIGDTPLLGIWFELCRRNDIREVVINVHAHATAVKDWVKENAAGLDVRVIEEEQLLGSAGTLRTNRDWVDGDDEFWVFYSDVLNRVDLKKMLHGHRQQRPAATLGLYRVPNPQSCGLVEVDGDGWLTSFIEKPEQPKGDLAFAGLLLATPDLLDVIPDKTPVDIGYDVLPRLVGRARGYYIEEYILDIGTRENYNRALKEWQGLDIQGGVC